MIKFHFINYLNKEYSKEFFENQEKRGYTLDTRLNNTGGIWHFSKREENEPEYEYSVVPVKRDKKYASIMEEREALDRMVKHAENKGWTFIDNGYRNYRQNMVVFKKPTGQGASSVYDSVEEERNASLYFFRGQFLQNAVLLAIILLISLFEYKEVLSVSDNFMDKTFTYFIVVFYLAFIFYMLFNIFIARKFIKENSHELALGEKIRYFKSKTFSVFGTYFITFSTFIILALIGSLYKIDGNYILFALKFISLMIAIIIFIIGIIYTRKGVLKSNIEDSQRLRSKFNTRTVILFIILIPIFSIFLADALLSFV